MAKSLLGGGAAAALLSFSLIFYAAGSTAAEPLASASQEPSTQQKTDASDETVFFQTTPVASEMSTPDASATKTLEIERPRLFNPRATQLSENKTAAAATTSGVILLPPQSFVATAYSLRGRTASGKQVQRGIIAADRRLLPLGTRVRLDAGNYSGEYLVADTGGAVRGRKIDIWVPSGSEAMRFGRRPVKLTILTHQRKPSAPTARGQR